MCSVAVSALLVFSNAANADEFSYDDPQDVDIDETWTGTEVSVKWGSQDAVHDRDGILDYSDTIGAIGVGSLYADVVSSGTGIVKSKTGWFEHSGTASNLATSTQSLKPFTIEGTGTQTVSMTISIDGLMAVDEDSAVGGAYSRAVLSYLTDIQTVGADGVREIVGDNSFDGYVMVGDGADIATTDPDDYGASVVDGGDGSYYNVPEYVSDDDMGGHDNTWYNNGGLEIKKVVTAVTDATTQIDNEDVLLDGTDADTYIAAGRSTYYVVYSQTFTFDAVAGQQYFVAMDLFTGTRLSGTGGAATADGWVMSDFYNTITYSLSGGTGVTTNVLIDDENTQTITGNNPFGGANTKVTLDDATLNLSVPAAMSEKYILAVGSENIINTAGNAGSISGVVSGSGSLVKEGAGALTLSGANTYTGGTTVTAGTITLGANNVMADTGSVAVSAGATLNVNGKIDAIGSLVGAGNVSLGTGTLAAGGDNASSTFAGVVSGTGIFSKVGDGTLILSGVNTSTGDLDVNEGILSMNGTWAGEVDVAAAGILKGSGTINDDLTVGGIVAPGNSIGTLTVGAGNYTQAADSRFEVEFEEDGDEDLLNVAAGTATITAGATLVPIAFDNVTTSQTYTFMTTSGGIVGTFSTIEDNYGVYDFAANKVGNNYNLVVTRQTYASALEAGSNATSLASTLDTVFAGAPGADMQSMMDTLDTLNPDDLNDAYEGLLPDVTGAAGMVTNTTTGQIQSLVGGRLGSVRGGGVSSGDEFIDKNAWVQTFYNEADQDTRKGFNGYEADAKGFALGADGRLNNNLVLGLAYGYGNSDSQSFSSGLDSDSHTFMVYGSYDFASGTHVDGMASYGVSEYDSARSTIMGTARGDYEGEQIALRADAGIDIPCYHEEFILTPTASARYSHVNLDDYQETGAPGANLYVAEQSADTFTVGLGAKASADIKQNEEWMMRPTISAGVTYDVAQDDVASTSRFVAGGGAFTTQGLTPSRTALEVGGNITFSRSDGLDVVVNYDGELREDYDSHTGLIRLKQSF